MEPNFANDIRDHIINRLWDYLGGEVDGCDLAYKLTESENIDGAWVMYRTNAIEYIECNWDTANEVYSYWQDYGYDLNPFDDPEKFTVFMLHYGVERMLSDIDYVKDHWDEEFILDEKAITTIVNEINEIEI